MRDYSSATTRRPITLRSRARLAERPAGARCGVARRIASVRRALVHVWRQGVYVNELLLARPWEQEGPLRWQREWGGPRLIGRGLGPEDAGTEGAPGPRD